MTLSCDHVVLVLLFTRCCLVCLLLLLCVFLLSGHHGVRPSMGDFAHVQLQQLYERLYVDSVQQCCSTICRIFPYQQNWRQRVFVGVHGCVPARHGTCVRACWPCVLVCPFVFFVCLSVSLSLSLCFFACLSVSLSLCLSVSLSLCLSLCAAVPLSRCKLPRPSQYPLLRACRPAAVVMGDGQVGRAHRRRGRHSHGTAVRHHPVARVAAGCQRWLQPLPLRRCAGRAVRRRHGAAVLHKRARKDRRRVVPRVGAGYCHRHRGDVQPAGQRRRRRRAVCRHRRPERLAQLLVGHRRRCPVQHHPGGSFL